MTSPTPRPNSEAEDKVVQAGLVETPASRRTDRVPQIIPDWAIDHLGKKVQLIRPYFDGCRYWFPDQVGTLDGLQTGASGVECVVYFDDCDDEGDFSAPAALLMPVYENNSHPILPIDAQPSLQIDASEPSVAKPPSHSFILGFAIELLSRAWMSGKRHKDGR